MIGKEKNSIHNSKDDENIGRRKKEKEDENNNGKIKK